MEEDKLKLSDLDCAGCAGSVARVFNTISGVKACLFGSNKWNLQGEGLL